MIDVDAGSFFAVIVTAALAAVIVVVMPRRLAPPVVVLELMLGIVIGPQVLGIAEPDAFIDFFSNLGLGMLFFFAGYEIDFERIRGKPLSLGAWGWLCSLVLAYGIGGALAAAGVVVSFLYTGSALATTAIGTLIPILRDVGELRTKFGGYLLGAGAVGEFGPILLITLVLSTTQPLHEALILIGFILIALLLALTSVRLVWRGFGALERTLESSSQLAVRISTVLVFGLVLLGLGARARHPAGRLRRRDDRARRAARPRARAVRVQTHRGRLRLSDPVLLRRERHRVQPRGARLGDRDRQAASSSLALFLVVRGVPAIALYRRELGRPRPPRPGVLLRHRAAARGRDHDDRDRSRGRCAHRRPPAWSAPPCSRP